MTAYLTPQQREVLVLRVAVGLSAQEAAQAAGSTGLGSGGWATAGWAGCYAGRIRGVPHWSVNYFSTGRWSPGRQCSSSASDAAP